MPWLPFCSFTPPDVVHLGREPPAYHARQGRQGRVRARTMGPAQRSALRPSLGLLGEPDGWRFRPLGMTRGVGRRRMVVRPRQRGEDRCGWRARARNRQRAGCGPRGPRPPFSEAQGQHGNGLGICLALLAPAPATRSRHSGAVRQPGEARDGAAGEVVGEGAVSGANREGLRRGHGAVTVQKRSNIVQRRPTSRMKGK